MMQVNIHEAKTRLSELVAAVERGEEIIIARAGKRVARLVADKPEPQRFRMGGTLAGLVSWDQAAWQAGDAEIETMFEDAVDSDPKS